MIYAIVLLICSFLLGARFWARFPAKTDKLIHRALPAPDEKLETEWSELSPDILRLVAKKLGDITNIVRFRVVCKQWRSAVSSSDLPSQLPWFLETQIYLLSSDINFYSLYTNKTHTLHVPEADGMFHSGPSKSYLILKDDIRSNPILVNPLSRHQFKPHFLMGRPPNVYTGDDRSYLSNPCAWIKVAPCCHLPSTFYKGDMFYYCLFTENTRVVSNDRTHESWVVPGKLDGFCYFVNIYDDLLAVVRVQCNTVEWRFKLYRLEQGGKTPFWAELTQGIGDRVLFLEHEGGFCLETSDFDGLEGSKIYSRERIGDDYYLVMYDLEKKTEHVVCPIWQYGTWFIPGL